MHSNYVWIDEMFQLKHTYTYTQNDIERSSTLHSYVAVDLPLTSMWLGGVVVEYQTCKEEVHGSIPARDKFFFFFFSLNNYVQYSTSS